MKWFMFGVTVLFGVLAIGAVIYGIAMLATGAVIAGLIGIIIAGALTVMAASVGKSLRETSS